MFRILSKFPVVKYPKYHRFLSQYGDTLNCQTVFPCILRKSLIQAWRPIFGNSAYQQVNYNIIDETPYYEKILKQLGINFECRTLFVNPTLTILNKYANNKGIEDVAKTPKSISFKTAGRIRKFLGDNQRAFFKTDGALNCNCKETSEKVDSSDCKKKRKNPKKAKGGTCPYIKEECRKGGKAEDRCEKLRQAECNERKKKAKNACRKSVPCKKKSGSSCKKKAADPCAKKEDPCKKKKCEDPCEKQCVDECKKKAADPCRQKEDPCKTKSKDPCKSQSKKSACKQTACKKKSKQCGDPCKPRENKQKKKVCCKRKNADPCKKGKKKGDERPICPPRDDTCKKTSDCKPKKKGDERPICPPRDDTCKKKTDGCKKKGGDPCKQKREDPCKEKADPCSTATKCRAKNEDPCKKKRDDPCKPKC